MAKKLKDAIKENARAAQDLDAALRDCIAAIRNAPDNVVEGRFRLIDRRAKASTGS